MKEILEKSGAGDKIKKEKEDFIQMDLFTTQIELIKKIGFLPWIKTYPINPLTLVAFTVMFGIIVLIINAKVRRRNAERNWTEGDALVILKKQNMSFLPLAEQVQVSDVDGDFVNWFFYKMRPAIYLSPGKRDLTVYAEWSKSIHTHYKTDPRMIQVSIKPDGIYSLYYLIETGEYLLCEGDVYEDEAWMDALKPVHFVG